MNMPSFGWTNEEPGSGVYIKRGIYDVLRKLSCKNILDAGCGNGDLAHFLQGCGYHVTGIDADREGILIARSKSRDSNFMVANFQESVGKFDAVISTEVIEHLYDPDQFMQFCRKSLDVGGYLVITTPYHGYIKNLVISIAGGWDRHFTARWYGGHIKFWSRKTLSDLLDDHGFDVTDFKGLGRFWAMWKSMIVVAIRRDV